MISSVAECGGKLAASLLVMLCCKEGMDSEVTLKLCEYGIMTGDRLDD